MNIMAGYEQPDLKSEVIGHLSGHAANKKRSVVVDGHRTSVSLEPIFWDQLREIAFQRKMSVNELITKINQQRNGSLTSGIRVFVLENVRKSQGVDSANFGTRTALWPVQ